MSLLIPVLWPLLQRYWSYGLIGTLGLLAWHFDARAVANANALHAQAAQFRQVQSDADSAAKQALLQQEALYTTKAIEADHEHQTGLAAARAAADRYVADHRVQPASDQGDAGGTAAGAQNNPARLSGKVPGDAVVVSTRDVQACTDAVTYAIDAHNWAEAMQP